MTPPLVYLFPGQSRFAPPCGRQFVNQPVFARALQECSEAAGFDVSEAAWGASSIHTGSNNGKVQVVHLSLCWALATVAEARMGKPDVVAGHSLGELVALVYSGALALAEGARFLQVRGDLVQQAVRESQQDLLVVYSSDRDVLAAIAETGRRRSVYLANINSSRQTLVAGRLPDLRAFAAELRERGLRSQVLGVGFGFHSPLLASAHPSLSAYILRLRIRRPRIPFFCVEADRVLEDPEEIRSHLLRHLLGRVDWKRAMHTLRSLGQQPRGPRFCEIGPKRILGGLLLGDWPDAQVSWCGDYL